jgi:hypothetical protein
MPKQSTLKALENHRTTRAAALVAMAPAPVATGPAPAPVVTLVDTLPPSPPMVLLPRPTHRALLSGIDARTGATGRVPVPVVVPSHEPTHDDNVGPVGCLNTAGPWDVNPYREGEPVNVTRDGHPMAPRAHTENVGWCRGCGAVARSSAAVTHGRRCTGAVMVGCHLPTALDGPDVLTRSVKVTVDPRTGRTILTGAAVIGTGATIRPESTPDMTARKAQRTRSTARRADGGRITVAQLHNYNPAVPVRWITAPTDPATVTYRARVADRATHTGMLGRLAVAMGTGGARRLPGRLVVADFREVRRLSIDETAGEVAEGDRSAAAYRAMATVADPPAPTTWSVPVKVTVLRANGEPLKTVRRRSRAAILAATAPAPMVAPVAAEVTADAAAMVAADRIG